MYRQVLMAHQVRKGHLIFIGNILHVVTQHPVKDFMGDLALNLRSSLQSDLTIDMRVKYNHAMEVHTLLV